MKKNLILIFTGLMILLSTVNAKAQQNKSTDGVAIKKGMIKVTVLYPAGDDKKFDMDYYSNKHIPMIKGLLAGALKLTEIDKGIGGGAPGAPAPFVMICYLYFDSVADYQNAMTTNGSKILADIPHYTNIQPVIQISEVVE
ncbi:MAG TPA: EthD family reductase [Mucilaginibacter sp.]|jgi:uncharacterized protein (TIGR02118 family)